MAKTGVDIISLDWTVDLEDACKRIPRGIGIQGNVDPGILFGNKESIKERIDNTFNKIKDRKYICLLYTSPSPRDATLSRMPSSA